MHHHRQIDIQGGKAFAQHPRPAPPYHFCLNHLPQPRGMRGDPVLERIAVLRRDKPCRHIGKGETWIDIGDDKHQPPQKRRPVLVAGLRHQQVAARPLGQIQRDCRRLCHHLAIVQHHCRHLHQRVDPPQNLPRTRVGINLPRQNQLAWHPQHRRLRLDDRRAPAGVLVQFHVRFLRLVGAASILFAAQKP